QLNVGLGQPVLPADKKNVTYLKVGLTGFALTRAEERAPVNVALVLDKSGSMSGEKIEHAKAAACLALDRLNSNDIVSVVVFDTTVSVLVPATKLTDRENVRAAIRRIEAGSTTALFAGVSKGAEEVRKFLGLERVNRVILLSDGQANVGPSSPSELGALGYSLRKEGISVTTLGLGMDYNEDLMAQLARRSDGNHYFVRQAPELETVFKNEFGDVLTVVAQEVSIRIHCNDGIRPVRLLGRDGEITGQYVYVQLNQLYSLQEKFAMLEVEIPATEAGRSREVATVTATYANMATKTTDKLSSTVSVTFTQQMAEVDKNENPKVMVSAVSMVANERNKEATWLRDQGKIAEAREILKQNESTLNTYGERFKDKGLVKQAELNDRDEKGLEGKDWDKRRKWMRNNQKVYEAQQDAGLEE
ncbi:MAG: VWA domain-containing protein, partial [Planctomycetota bacterium]